jgi:hypothetical protein
LSSFSLTTLRQNYWIGSVSLLLGARSPTPLLSAKAVFRHRGCFRFPLPPSAVRPVRFIGVVVSPLCMVTEFCERGNLFDLLHNRDVPLSWPLRKKMALDAATGMACTWRRGVVDARYCVHVDVWSVEQAPLCVGVSHYCTTCEPCVAAPSPSLLPQSSTPLTPSLFTAT